jgi:receptor protein-tyrosine kinase
MELVRYLLVLRSRWRVLVAIVLVAVAAAWFLTPRQHVYKATSTLYIGSRSIDLKNASDVAFVAALDRFIQTFADMIDSAPVAAKAIERAGVQRSADSVVKATTARQVGGSGGATGTNGTQLLAIDVTDPDPVIARKLTNALADSFVEEVQTFEPGTPVSEGALPALPAYVFEQARLPTVPEPTGLASNLGVAALVGLALGIGGVLLSDYLDITVRGIEEAERRLDLPVLGAVPELAAAPSGLAASATRTAEPRAVV